MTTYYNEKTGEYYYEGSSMTRLLDNGYLFAGVPNEEQLAEWGFEPYTPPTPQVDVREQRMLEILAELAETDYLALKAFEGEDMSEHPGWKEHRAALREEYRQLESNLNNDEQYRNIHR